MQKQLYPYFFSDLHLGFPNPEVSRQREKQITDLLDILRPSTESLWFLGDIFDFWWEYNHVAPKGHIRFLGKLAELADAGIPLHFFSGNHDIWMKKYLQDEIGLTIHHKPHIIKLMGKRLYMAHGDGLGPGDANYKFLKKIFTNRFLQWAFTRLHPNFAFGLANRWSHARRKKEPLARFTSRNNELLIKYAENLLQNESYDFFVFGHRHIPMKLNLSGGAKLINTGEWLNQQTFASLQDGDMQLLQYKEGRIIEYPYSKPEKNPHIQKK